MTLAYSESYEKINSSQQGCIQSYIYAFKFVLTTTKKNYIKILANK